MRGFAALLQECHHGRLSYHMATSKNFFGNRRGSTKSLTFQVYRGKQVTKDRVTDVANPQSAAQMKQRLKLPLVANARAALKTLVNHSFEGISYGEESLRYFSAANLKKGNLYINEYVPKDIMDSGMSNLVISKGSLEGQQYDLSYNNGVPNGKAVYTTMEAIADGEFPEQDKEGVAITESQLTQVCNLLGLSGTSQLTFLICYKGDTYKFGGENGDSYTGHYHRYIVSRIYSNFEDNKDWKYKFDPSNTEGVVLDDGYIRISFDGFNAEQKKFSAGEATDSTISISMGDDLKIENIAIIYSRQDDNVWKRSTARFIYVDGLSTQQTYANVLPTYLKTGTTSTKYINNGDGGVSITGGSAISNISMAKNDEDTSGQANG